MRGQIPKAQDLADEINRASEERDIRRLKGLLELVEPSAQIGILHQYERIADAVEMLCNAIMEKLNEEEGEEWKN